MAKQAILSRRGSSWSLCSSSSTSSLNQFRQHHTGVVKFKTELCNNFMETGKCPYGEACKFAHGKNDIQEQLPPNMKYKSELCRDYHGKGICYFGVRCHFVHEKPNPWKSLEEFWKKLGLINDETSRKL